MEGNPWDILPTEDACKIISNLSDFQDIFSYMQSSKRFIDLARVCVRFLTSPEKIQVDLKLIQTFRVLEGTDENIIIVINSETIPLLSTLPVLRQGNFYLEGDLLQDHLLPFLTQLNLGQKLLQVNVRIWDDLTVLFVQGTRFMMAPPSREVFELIQKNYPQLEYFDLYTITILAPAARVTSRLLSRRLRSFLNEADFGLVYPDRPPSQNNPPLSIYIKRLAISGLGSPLRLPDLLLIIYPSYHGLYKTNILIPDQLMTKYLRQIDADSLLELSTNGNEIISPTEYDIPIVLNPQDRDLINNAIDIASQTYLLMQSTTLYRTDGSTFTL